MTTDTPKRITTFAMGLLLLAGFMWTSGCAARSGGGGGAPGANANVQPDENANGGEPAPSLFAVSGQCSACHNGLTDEADNDVSIEALWRGTMMANAARDPYFLAKVSTEIARNPSLQQVIEDTCAKCHTPMAHTQATADATSTALFGDGFLDGDNALHAEAVDGVSCTVCHQITDEALGEDASFSGKYEVDTTTEKPDRVNYGPYSDPQGGGVMQAASGFLPVEGAHVTESALCAACHTLFTPYVDGDGQILGEFPEQVAFLEWQHSDYGDGVGADDQTCQDCHLPDAEGAVVISTAPGGLAARTPFGRHHFVGGNVFMLKLHKDHGTELEMSASAADLDATISRTLTQLQQDAAEMQILLAQVSGDTLTVDLAIENKVGHKLPTGFPSRRAWIHLAVTDGGGATVFESGAPQADGSIAGNDADADLVTFEPHYTTITDPDQVQIYQSVMQDSDDEVTHTLLRAASYVKDNRLLPRGFDKATAGDDFAVLGQAAQDGDFNSGSDEITYEIDVSGHSGPFSVTANVLYQSVAVPFVEDLRTEDEALAERFVGYFDAADKTPTTIATVEQTVE